MGWEGGGRGGADWGNSAPASPPPLSIAPARLADGRGVKGFIVEPADIAGARDISAFNGWRAFVAEAAAGELPLVISVATGRANAPQMTGPAKQYIIAKKLDCFLVSLPAMSRGKRVPPSS